MMLDEFTAAVVQQITSGIDAARKNGVTVSMPEAVEVEVTVVVGGKGFWVVDQEDDDSANAHRVRFTVPMRSA